MVQVSLRRYASRVDSVLPILMYRLASGRLSYVYNIQGAGVFITVSEMNIK